MIERTTCHCGAPALPCGCCHAAHTCEAHQIRTIDAEMAMTTDFRLKLAVTGLLGMLIGAALWSLEDGEILHHLLQKGLAVF